MVVPDDMNRDEILDVNQNHPLIHHRWPILLPGDLPGSPQSPPWVRGRPGGARPRIPAEGAGLHPPGDLDPIDTRDQRVGIVGFPTTNTPGGMSGTEARQSADPHQTLVTIAAPILAGFSLAAIVAIGTSAPLSGRPDALPAMACFAGAAVLLLFSVQLMAIARLISIRWWHWASLYELGLLTFLVG